MKYGNKERKTVDLSHQEWEWLDGMVKKFTVAYGGEKISRNQVISWIIEEGREKLEERLKKIENEQADQKE